jgi:flagellar biosynthesis/type III secretory pathway chaperone
MNVFGAIADPRKELARLIERKKVLCDELAKIDAKILEKEKAAKLWARLGKAPDESEGEVEQFSKSYPQKMGE